MVCGPKGQSFTQPGPFGPGINPTKVFMRPEGPFVPFDESKDQRNVWPFRPQILFLNRFPGPIGPGWVNDWPTWAVRLETFYGLGPRNDFSSIIKTNNLIICLAYPKRSS